MLVDGYKLSFMIHGYKCLDMRIYFILIDFCNWTSMM
uniref:Uncharacterized protein n=1 Tax=Rhizophora mucronata TaxID=61149 RepID=A0A2P2P568_RHIMU